MTVIGTFSTSRRPPLTLLGLALLLCLPAACGGGGDGVELHAVVDDALADTSRPAVSASTITATTAVPAPPTTGDGPADGEAGDGAGSDGGEGDAEAEVAGASSDPDRGPATTVPAATGQTAATAYPLGQRTLPTTADGSVVPQTTPAALVDRRLTAPDVLPPPTSGRFESTIEPLAGEPLARSTWKEGCPVGRDQLRYLTVSFWGFDGRPHQGELIVHQQVADDIVAVFATLYDARYPIEEMRITTQAELDADPTGDGNSTSAFVCRAVTGGSSFSEHASGLAIDINPFQNPYEKGDLVLPELAAAYLDRSRAAPGIITEGDVVVDAFDAIGWGWGGRWRSLKDYQHFSLNNR